MRTCAKRGGNQSVITKLINEAEGLIKADETDEQRLKIGESEIIISLSP